MELDEVPVKDYQPTMQSNYDNSEASNISKYKQQSKQHIYEKLCEELKIYEQNYKEFENKYKSLKNNFNNILSEKQELKKTLVEQIILNQKLQETNDYNSKLIKPLVETLEEKNSEIQEKEKEIQELKLKNTDTSKYPYFLEPDDNLIKLKMDIESLQESLEDYVTKCKGNVEINIPEVQKLLKKYGSETVIAEQAQNKPLIRAVLQRHVIQQIFIYAKEYFGDPEKHHGFISRYQRLLNEEIDKYRKFKNSERKKEIEGMAGSIIKKVVTLFWFHLNVQEPIANYTWFKYDDKIDPSYMKGKWGKDEIDNITVDICYFPLITQDSSKCCIYTLARIFHKSKQSSSSKDLLNSNIQVDEITEQTITVNSIQPNYNPSNNPQNNTSFPIIIKDFIEDTKQEIEDKDSYIQYLEDNLEKLTNVYNLLKNEFDRVQENNDKLLKENQRWKQDFMKEKNDHEQKLRRLEAQYNERLDKELRHYNELDNAFEELVEENKQWEHFGERKQEITEQYKEQYEELQLSYNDLALQKQNMEQKFAKDKEDYEKNINNLKQHIEKQNSGYEISLQQPDDNSIIKLKEDIISLQDSLDDYVTKCKGDNIEVNFSEVQTLFEKYGSKSNIKDQKLLIKLVLQRHVIEKIHSYSKKYFGNPERHYLKLYGIETNVYKQANDLIELTKIFAAGRDGVDETTKLLPTKLRQLIYATLGTRGFNDMIDSKNNKIPNEFISHYQKFLNEEMSKYRKHKDPKKNQEIERMAGNIIKEVVTLFWFRLKVQEPVADAIWIKNDDKIDPSYMEGKWEKDEIDKFAVDICYFPLIAQEYNNNDKSKRHIYTPARILHKYK